MFCIITLRFLLFSLWKVTKLLEGPLGLDLRLHRACLLCFVLFAWSLDLVHVLLAEYCCVFSEKLPVFTKIL